MRAPTGRLPGTPARLPALPGPASLTEVAADDGDGDLVHEHRPEAHVLFGAALTESAQDLHLRVVLADAPVRQEPELGAHGGQGGGARRGAGPLDAPGRSLGLAGGRAAGVPGEREPRLRSRRCARRLCSPDPANLPGHSAPPPARASQSARGGGRGPAARPAAEAASAGGAREGRRGRGPAADGGGAAPGGRAPGSPRVAGGRLARQPEGIPAPPGTPVGVASPAGVGRREREGPRRRPAGRRGCPRYPAKDAQRAAGCVPNAVASGGVRGAPVGPSRVPGRASGTSQGGFWGLAKVTREGPQLDPGLGILCRNPGLELGWRVGGFEGD